MRPPPVEDGALTADHVVSGPCEEGHDVGRRPSRPTGLDLACTRDHDVLVVDPMLRGLDGLSLVGALRSTGRTAPVILLTAVGGVDDRAEEVEAGADDDLPKPFAVSKLLACLDAPSRRAPGRREDVVPWIDRPLATTMIRTVRRSGDVPHVPA